MAAINIVLIFVATGAHSSMSVANVLALFNGIVVLIVTFWMSAVLLAIYLYGIGKL
jgi:hypothetical protein